MPVNVFAGDGSWCVSLKRTATNCNTLGKEAPGVVLAGDCHAARVGVSILNNIGLPELIAHDRDEYVRIAVALARDTRKLKSIQSTLRDRMRRSELMNYGKFTRGLETSYRQIWKNWCRRKNQRTVAVE